MLLLTVAGVFALVEILNSELMLLVCLDKKQEQRKQVILFLGSALPLYTTMFIS